MFATFTGSSFGRGFSANSATTRTFSQRRTRVALRRPTPLHTIIAA